MSSFAHPSGPRTRPVSTLTGQRAPRWSLFQIVQESQVLAGAWETLDRLSRVRLVLLLFRSFPVCEGGPERAVVAWLTYCLSVRLLAEFRAGDRRPSLADQVTPIDPTRSRVMQAVDIIGKKYAAPDIGLENVSRYVGVSRW